ncbi:hypothetical protein BJF78_14900 [Pseudonocardia sp. CNS-139]|nr:hypothetical protein BJF78_14900 [Pseudonocardia sp. CNS-139]
MMIDSDVDSDETRNFEPRPFDPLASGRTTEIREELSRVRNSGCPATEVAPGVGFVSGHDLAREALLAQPPLSNRGNFVLDAPDDGPAPPALITQSDPPEHTALRACSAPGSPAPPSPTPPRGSPATSTS